jgi:Zn finger protein HypA/HybF involved in hydrogenase expression
MKVGPCLLCGSYFESDYNRLVCPGCDTKRRRLSHKIYAIEYKGGKCEHCGYEFNYNNIAAFVFHHKDPNIKDGNLARIIHKSLDNVLKEVDKCMLLCANCHSIVHSNITDSIMFRVKEDVVQIKAERENKPK